MDSGEQGPWRGMNRLLPKRLGLGSDPLPTHEASTFIARSALERLLSRLAQDIVSNAPERPSLEEVSLFCDALLEKDTDKAERILADAHASGMTGDSIYAGYIAGAARQLGDAWAEDSASFVDVSLASTRLHVLVHAYRHAFHESGEATPNGCTALFVPVPGETHRLGVLIAAEYFRRTGWTIDVAAPTTSRELSEMAENGPYDVVGISTGSHATLASLADCVGALRDCASPVTIAVGGPLVAEEPDILTLSGADVVIDKIEIAPHSLRDIVQEKKRAATTEVAGQ